MNQSDHRIPKSGEGWRHYKGGHDSLYTIVGMSHNADGIPTVVYTPYRCSTTELPPLYDQPIDRFLQVIGYKGSTTGFVQRFTKEREIGDDTINPFVRGFVATDPLDKEATSRFAFSLAHMSAADRVTAISKITSLFCESCGSEEGRRCVCTKDE